MTLFFRYFIFLFVSGFIATHSARAERDILYKFHSIEYATEDKSSITRAEEILSRIRSGNLELSVYELAMFYNQTQLRRSFKKLQTVQKLFNLYQKIFTCLRDLGEVGELDNNSYKSLPQSVAMRFIIDDNQYANSLRPLRFDYPSHLLLLTRIPISMLKELNKIYLESGEGSKAYIHQSDKVATDLLNTTLTKLQESLKELEERISDRNANEDRMKKGLDPI